MPNEFAAQRALEEATRAAVKAETALDGIHRINGNIATFAAAMETFRNSVEKELTEMTRQVTRISTQLAIAGVVITLIFGASLTIATYFLTNHLHKNQQLIQHVHKR